MKNPSHFNDSESPYLTPTSEEKDDLIKEISAKESKRTYQCAYPDCGKLFSFKSEITRHILIHKETRPHTCSYEDCSKTFKRKDALVNHLKLHEEVLPYLCDAPECGKRFATKAAIRYHKMTHDNKRTYKCNINGCRKSFLTPSQLKQHQSASYIHFKKSKSSKGPAEISREELFTARISNELNQGVVKSEPKPGEIIQWETKSQRNDPNAPQKNETEKFDALYSYLLRENQILREKMQEYQKNNNLYEKEQNQQTFRFEPDDTIFQLLPQDLSMFISSDELKFLEFHQEG